MSKTKAHCNTCGGDRTHEILHSEPAAWRDDEKGISGSDTYDTLKCGGCESIQLRHTSWFSENEESDVHYFPPAIFRKPPGWFSELYRELEKENEFVEDLLMEIYVAVQNNLSSLATMGVRSLLERIMIAKGGDQGTFPKNIAKFEDLGHVSKRQRERLEAILDAGHAAIHRAYSPSKRDVITLLEITENIVESVFMHDRKVTQLKAKVPPRPKKGGV